MAKCLGITGGIGAGKSTISKIFQSLGVPTFDADTEAKNCYKNISVQEKITTSFGEGIFLAQKLQPKILADRVFAFPDKLRLLEEIIHPLVHDRWMEFSEGHKEKDYIIRENAILIQSGGHLTCDKILLITAPIEDRISRVMNRSKLSREAVLERIQNQWTEEQMRPECHYFIDNKEHLIPSEALIPQVIQIDKLMRS